MTKTIVLTGADGEIGQCILQSLLKANYSVLGIVKSREGMEKLRKSYLSRNSSLNILQMDLLRSHSYTELSGYLKASKKTIYGLINNAGIYPIRKFEDYDIGLWNHVINVNLTSAFLLSQIIFPYMKVEGGRIINIASTGAHLGSRDVGYSASKAGLIGLTKSLARSLASNNILVNAIAPGTIITKMSKRMKKSDLNLNMQRSVLKRLGIAEDIVPSIHFLLDESNSYITGFTIDINGGIYIR